MTINSQQYIRDNISGTSSCRTNCPSCGGANSLSISRIDGFIIYHCFRASCGLRGKLNDELSIDDLKSLSNSMAIKSVLSSSRTVAQQYYEVPNHFTSPLQNAACFKLLNRYSLIDFYVRNPEIIRYDPKLDRLVFILKDHKGVIKGATGRSLYFGNIPRWRVYERIASCPFIVSNTKEISKVLLVEDCISTSCLANMVSSIGLLGTSIPDDTIQYLLPYDKLYVALDDDATGKAIKLQKKLSAYKETHIIQLRKDIKYFSSEEKIELIRSL